jgi:NUMOD3 motif
MPKKISFCEVQQTAMIIAYVGGRSFQDIATAFACSKNRIRDELLLLGIAPNKARSISSKMLGQPSRRLGAKWSDESKKKASAARRKRGATRFGPHTEETKLKISLATKGKNTKWSHEEKCRIERLRQALKRFLRRSLCAAKSKKHDKTSVILGYSPSDLFRHLGPKPSDDCHIDHYVPISEFIRRGIHDPSVINSLHNLRWLGANENREKSNKVPIDADHVISMCINARHTFSVGIGCKIADYSKGIA